MVNVPLSDDIALRVNGVWNQSDGWIEDAATGKDLWPEENWAMRAALKWDLSEATSATLTWDHDELDQLARPAIGLVALGDRTAARAYPARSRHLPGSAPRPGLQRRVGNEESRTFDGLTLFIDHELGWADFRSTTAWRTFETVNREDEDGTNRIALYFDTANIEDNDSWYQEFKFSGQSEPHRLGRRRQLLLRGCPAGERHPRLHRQHRHAAAQPGTRRDARRHAVRLHQRRAGGARYPAHDAAATAGARSCTTRASFRPPPCSAT